MLSEREQQILREIIDSYVETAQPVGSRTVAQRLGLGLSPATIRNTMMDLEDSGYIGQPHTSAGRVPTDRGYRAYVDGLLQGGLAAAARPEDALAPGEEEWIEEQFASAPRDLAGLLDQAARLLAGASRQLALVLIPSFDRGVLEGIELVRVSPHRVLVVLRVQEGLVRTVVLDVTTTLDSEWLTRSAARLNERLVGLTLGEVRTGLAERLRAGELRDDEVVLQLLAAAPAWLNAAEGGDPAALYVGGTANMVSQPEFRVPERLLGLMSLVEDRVSLLRLLNARRAAGGMQITIGHENPAGPLEVTSLVTCTYARGPISGMLGILGPTRMPYHRVVGILHHVGRQIDRHFA